jgi:hypothetical protein
VFRTIAFNSFFYFLLAYVAVNTINLFVTGFTALAFNIPVIVYYFDVDYLIRGIDWTPDSVSGVFSSGPIAMLVLSFFLFILYRSVEMETGSLRLLVLWMIFHTLTRLLGEILAGALFNTGFGFVILYMFVMDTGKVILTIFGFVALFVSGLAITRLALYSANTYFNDLLAAFRTRFLYYQFIVPFLLGNALIFLVKIPNINYFDVTVNASMILMIIPVIVRSFGMSDFYFDQDPRESRVNWKLPAAALAAMILFRVVLGIGIRL